MNKIILAAWFCVVVYPVLALIATWLVIQHATNIDLGVSIVFTLWFAAAAVTVGITVRNDWRVQPWTLES